MKFNSIKKRILAICFLALIWLAWHSNISVTPITISEATVIANQKNTLLKESIPPSKKKQLTAQKTKNFSDISLDEQFCYFKKNFSLLKFNDRTEFQSNSEMNKDGYLSVWYIKDDSCPQGTYSIFKFKENGTLHTYLDCERTDQTEMFLHTHFQYNIEPAPQTPEHLNLAINGYGYFVVMCKDHNFYITRKGEFTYVDGLLQNEDNCFLAAQHQALVALDKPEVPDERGCFQSQNICVATIHPSDYNRSPGDLKFINQEYTKFDYYKYQKTIQNTNPHWIFSGVKELRYNGISTPEGLPSWEHGNIHKAPIICD
ncbi:MAG: hypothetical protein V4654_09910 [Bdellovibrionota bacterium]